MQRSLKNLSAETISKGRITIRSDRLYSVFEMWKKIVGDLSDMLITQETDRLPALAGIASLLAPSMGGGST